MIPISKPVIGTKEQRAVAKVLQSGILASGPKTQELETDFAAFCGTKYALAVNNGTAALHTALQAAIKPGDEVITTPFTFVSTANAILMAGGRPVFADIDEQTFNIDPKQIEQVLTKKTRAILTVNLYGQPADYTEINTIAKRYNLVVIEDAAQSINAKYQLKISGNLADIACFSLYATKNIMCGEGGVVTTNNRQYYDQMITFRNHGQRTGKRYEYAGLGYNYRLPDVLSAIAVVQLKRLNTITKIRQAIAKRYHKAFSKIKGLVIPHTAKNRTHVFHQYTFRVTKEFPMTRDKLKLYLEKKGIQSNIYYPIPLYRFDHLPFQKRQRDFPVTNKIIQEVLSIPIHPLLTKKEIDYIIKTICSV